MNEQNAKSFIQGIQDEAERLTLKRIKDDNEEQARLEEETKAVVAGDTPATTKKAA